MWTDTRLADAFEAVTGRTGNAVDRAGYAPATVVAYAESVRRFEAWLAALGQVLPVDAATVCAWLDALQLGAADADLAGADAPQARSLPASA